MQSFTNFDYSFISLEIVVIILVPITFWMFFKLRMANSLLLKNLRISKNLIENEKELNKILTSTLVDLKQESRKLQTNSLELLSLYNEESEMINI
jgi:hypothetical protein